jgi:HEAT repeat protein
MLDYFDMDYRLMKKSAAFLLLFLMTLPSYGVELRLKNGTVYKGVISAEESTSFTFETGSGKLKIAKSSIAAIDGQTYPSAKAPPPRQPGVRPLGGGGTEQNKTVAPAEQSPAARREWVILLKNGSVIKGRPKSQNKRVLVLESKNTPVTVFKNIIVSIDSTGGVPVAQVGTVPENAAPPSPRVATTAAGNTAASTDRVSAGTPQHRRGVSPPVTLDGKSVSPATGAGSPPVPPVSAPASVPVAPKKIKTNIVTMNTSDQGGTSGRKEPPATLPETGVIPASEVANAPSAAGVLPAPKSRVKIAALSRDPPVSGNRPPDPLRVPEKSAPPASGSIPETSRTADSVKTGTISLIPAPRTPGMGVSRHQIREMQTVRPEVPARAATKVSPATPVSPSPRPHGPAPVPPLANATGGPAPAPAARTPGAAPVPAGTAGGVPAPRLSNNMVTEPHPPVSSDVSQTVPADRPGVQKIQPLSLTTVPPVPVASPLPPPARAPQTRSVTVPPVPPMEKTSAPKIRSPRTDGKKELTMVDGTVFVGTILSETDHVIAFSAEGASLTILKHLIKAIDGEPYTVSKKVKKRPAVSSVPVSVRDNPKNKKAPPRALFRILPTDPLPEGTSTESLAGSLKFTGDWKVRSRAARYTGEMGPWGVALVPEVTALLADTAQSTMPIPEWIDSTTVDHLLAPGLEAARALAQLGAQGEAELLKALKHPNPMMRRHAVFGLGNCFLESSEKAVREALKDTDPTVRKVALGSLRVNSSRMLLSKMLNDSDPGVRGSAACLLGKLADRTAVEPLTLLTKDRAPEVRRQVAAALGTIAAAETVDPLMLLCKDNDHFVRAEAVRALGRTKAGNAAEPLLEALKDPANDVRASAVEALGLLRDSRSIPSLYAALKDKDRAVREKAAVALKNHTELSSLIAALDDASTAVRANVAYVLWLMTGQDLGQDREKWEAWAAATVKKTSDTKSDGNTK